MLRWPYCHSLSFPLTRHLPTRARCLAHPGCLSEAGFHTLCKEHHTLSRSCRHVCQTKSARRISSFVYFNDIIVCCMCESETRKLFCDFNCRAAPVSDPAMSTLDSSPHYSARIIPSLRFVDTHMTTLYQCAVDVVHSKVSENRRGCVHVLSSRTCSRMCVSLHNGASSRNWRAKTCSPSLG